MTNPERPPLFKTFYKVGRDNVFLTIDIGEKQLGSSIVRLEGTMLKAGTIKDLDLGKGSVLAGHKLAIKTVVTDINHSTNRTSTTIILAGGTVPAEHTLSVDVVDEHDSAIYRSEVEFVS